MKNNRLSYTKTEKQTVLTRYICKNQLLQVIAKDLGRTRGAIKGLIQGWYNGRDPDPPVLSSREDFDFTRNEERFIDQCVNHGMPVRKLAEILGRNPDEFDDCGSVEEAEIVDSASDFKDDLASLFETIAKLIRKGGR